MPENSKKVHFLVPEKANMCERYYIHIQNIHQDDILEEWSNGFVSRESPVLVPVNDFCSPSNVIKDDGSVLVVKTCRSFRLRIESKVNDIQKVDAFGLNVVILTDLVVDPF